MYTLNNFTLEDMTKCGGYLRKLKNDANSMEQVAQNIARYLYENLRDEQTQQPACALVRFFKTHPYGELPQEIQKFAQQMWTKESLTANVKCLTLLGTAGKIPAWNSKEASTGHQAIPLVSEKLVAQVPMISRLIQQFGLEISTVLTPDPQFLVDIEQKTYNVFYVPQASGSPYIPAQSEFVIPRKIESVLGFGGLLPTGNLFATILFSQVKIPPETAGTFKVLALNAKIAILPFEEGKVFTKN